MSARQLSVTINLLSGGFHQLLLSNPGLIIYRGLL